MNSVTRLFVEARDVQVMVRGVCLRSCEPRYPCSEGNCPRKENPPRCSGKAAAASLPVVPVEAGDLTGDRTGLETRLLFHLFTRYCFALKRHAFPAPNEAACVPLTLDVRCTRRPDPLPTDRIGGGPHGSGKSSLFSLFRPSSSC